MDNTLLKAELIRDEGKHLKAYKDSVGLWTIGVGHLLGSTPRMLEITEAECEALFNYDIDTAEKVVEKLFPHFKQGAGGSILTFSEDEDVRARVLVNMAFNLGPARLAEFKKFVAMVRLRAWADAAREMMDSKWATQVGKRALRLRDMMRDGKVGTS